MINFSFQNTRYNTYPFFVHCPSRAKLYQKDFLKLKSFFQGFDKNIQTETNADIPIITWNTSNNPSVLEKSLDYFGNEYYSLGRGITKWNYLLKLSLSLDFIKNCSTKYILGIDGYDAVAIRKFNSSIVDVINQNNIQLIFNKTYFESWPNISNIYGEDYKLNYLNSGAWFGRTEFVKKFFEYCLYSACDVFRSYNKTIRTKYNLKYSCDQTLIKICGHDYIEDIGLDNKYEIFNIIGSKGTSGLILDF